MGVLVTGLSFYLVVCVFHTLCWRGEGCDEPDSCAISPTITPPQAVLQYGSPLSANCSMCGEDSCNAQIKWEVPSGRTRILALTSDNGMNRTIVQWDVAQTTEWGIVPLCYGIVGEFTCCTRLHVTLYKPPDNVSISFVNHRGPLLEGHQYTLQCHVQDVAPVQNLTVTFYRGDAMLGWVQSSRNSMETPVSETFTVSINSSREDDGGQYWCEAKLDLGPHGPQPPLVMRSQKLKAMVYFKPEMVVASRPDPITITDGETLQLNCTAYSNPSPAYSWIGPHNTTVGNDSVLTVHSASFEHEGQYVCVTSNNQGSTTMKLYVDVSVDFLPIVAGLVALALVIAIIIGGFVYTSHYRHTRTGHYKLKDVFHMHWRNEELQNGSR